MNDHHEIQDGARLQSAEAKPSQTTTPSMACELITAVQLAELLNISERTLYRLKSSHRLPKSISLGGSVRWRLADVRKWIADGCEPPVDR